jgi:hypothetical protein
MFFREKIKSIRPTDRVLEIGPGSTPFSRANEFLEYRFESEADRIQQRGGIKLPPEFGGRKVSYYDGEHMPFRDKEFDYVIASHVIEHVQDPNMFMAEIYRIGGGRGYVEFPLPPYDFLFDFGVHRHFIWFDEANNQLNYLPKVLSAISEFFPITREFQKSLELGWDDLVAQNQSFFFFGIEFAKPFIVVRREDLLQFNREFAANGRTLKRRLARGLIKCLP